MSYQFIHVECYSRSSGRNGGHSVSDILAESRREPAACLHVQDPKQPVLVVGCDLDELEQRHDSVIANARETLANGKSRAVRKDTASLFTCILSHPATPDECRADPDVMKAVKSWAKDSARWLRRDIEARGGVLEAVVMHIDESHVHLHAYGLHPSGHADLLHAGKSAKKGSVAAALAAGHDKKSANRFGDKAYVEAMRAWQDSYSAEIGLTHGLTRLGPARRRLSRAEWKSEQAAARNIERARKAEIAAQAEVEAARGVRDRMIAQGRQMAYKTALRAHREMQSACALRAAAANAKKRGHRELDQARRDAKALRASAERDIRRVRSIGSTLRALWDSLWISAVRRRILQDAQAIVAGETAKVRAISDRLRDESRRRRNAERRLSDAITSARVLGHERDEMRAKHDRLLKPSHEVELRNRPILR